MSARDLVGEQAGAALPEEHVEVLNYVEHPEYKGLDDGIKDVIGAKEFAWLPDTERARFLHSCIEAEGFSDA